MLGLVPFTANSDHVKGYSLPYLISICMFDDGGGGSFYLNGLGVNNGDLSGAYDLKTWFATNNAPFNSLPVLQPFRRLTGTPSSVKAEDQLVPGLDIQMIALVTPVAPPAISYLAAIGSGDQVSVPFIKVDGPGAAGTWRIDIRRRHSITN